MDENTMSMVSLVVTAVSGILAFLGSIFQGAATEFLRHRRSEDSSDSEAKKWIRIIIVICWVFCMCSLVVSAILFFRREPDLFPNDASSGFVEVSREIGRGIWYEMALDYSYGRSTEIDDIMALEYFQLLKDTNADARAYVGYYYYRGWGGLEADREEALKRYESARKEGSTMALCFLAEHCLCDTEMEERYEQAADLCRQAVEAGCEKAYGLLGFCCLSEESSLRDLGQAFDFFERGAEVKDDAALYGLGLCYQEGYVVDSNEDRALECFRQSAGQGNTYANVRLGRYYYDLATEDGDEQAWEYFSRAAARRNTEAMYMMGQLCENGRGCEKDISEALAWYQRAADQGYVDALHAIAYLYYIDEGNIHDYDKAFPLFLEAAEKGCTDSFFYLGYCYKNGLGVEEDLEKAQEWYTKAAGDGGSAAQNNLGWLLYDQGEYVEAREWFTAAADQGSKWAQFGLGECFYYGNGVGQNYEQARFWYEKAAAQDYVKAMVQLGNIAQKGLDGADYETAFQWYQKAADLGSAEGRYRLGLCYYDQTGVEKDDEKAFEWFKKAADQGHASAQSQLGVMYFRGYGVEVNLVRAVDWFKKSAEKGNAFGQCWLGYCYFHGYGIEQNWQEAVRWFTMAAEGGNIAAKRYLGYCSIKGKGTEKDYEKAVYWLEQAAEKNDADAQHWLGKCYENGWGVEVDEQKAAEYYELAVVNGYEE